VKTKPLEFDDPRLQEAASLALQADSEPEHAAHVCATALALFDATAALHGLGESERALLTAAALFHDTGWATQPAAHHKGSRDFILESGLSGFSETELKTIACVARYHRKAHPKPTHKVYRDLDEDSRTTVNRLASILRIADGMDRSHWGTFESVRVEPHTDMVRLHVTQRTPNGTDIWGAMRKRQLFEETFCLDVEIVAEEPDS
jgi:exopolyphosphatase / guanosine-5'-triphosphate,3'-diphosphate pyrophosphatase